MKRQDMSDLVAVAKSEINFSSRSGGAEITLTRIDYCRKFFEHREQFFHNYVDIPDRFRVFFYITCNLRIDLFKGDILKHFIDEKARPDPNVRLVLIEI